MKSFRYLLSFVLLLIFLFPWPGIFYALQVTHLPSQRKLLTFPFLANQIFHISFINSLYMASVVEAFEVRGSIIYLKEIASKSREVIEYYNISGTISQSRDEIKIQDINFKVPKLTLMIGFVGKQQLLWKNQTYPLFNLAGPGGILVIEARSLSPVHYFWQSAIHSVFLRTPSSEGEKI